MQRTFFGNSRTGDVLRKTAANYIKNDVKFATDIFRGTPCINHKNVTETVIVISSDPFWKC